MSEAPWTLQQDVQLREANTLALPSRARWLAHVHDPQALPQLLALPQLRELPRRVLGGGSNLVLPAELEAVVLKPTFSGLRIANTDTQGVEVIADAGLNWHALVQWSVQQGWHGIENLALIPGQCGAAPIQNIGAYGVELAAALKWVEWMELPRGQLQRTPVEALQLGYRHSMFKQLPAGSFMIVRICVQLKRQSSLQIGYAGLAQQLQHHGVHEPTPADVFDAVCALRRSKLPDPAVVPNAGSFFKNPLLDAEAAASLRRQWPQLPVWPQADGRCKLSAAWLIEQAGFKGARLGEAAVSAQHALVLTNAGHADADAISALSTAIQQGVLARFGVSLDTEPQFW